MAGDVEWLVSEINKQGGADSDYADVLFGTVTSGSPLKVEIANGMVLDKTFLALTKTADDANLKKGDGVVIIRGHGNRNSTVGGQQFIVIDKIGG